MPKGDLAEVSYNYITAPEPSAWGAGIFAVAGLFACIRKRQTESH